MDRISRGTWRHWILPLVGMTAIAGVWLVRPQRPLPSNATSAAVASRESPADSVNTARCTSRHSSEPSLLVVPQRPVALPAVRWIAESVQGTGYPTCPASAPSYQSDPMSEDIPFPPIEAPSPSATSESTATASEPVALSTETASFPVTQSPAATPLETQRSATPIVPKAAAKETPAAAVAASPSEAPATWSGVRSQQLEAAAQEADRHTRDGFNLAGRGAHFAARSEFFTALEIVAQALDAERQTRRYTEALAAAKTALAEAEDFLPRRQQQGSDIEIAVLVRSHRTSVLSEATDVAPVEAMKGYLTFAQEQLAIAGGAEIASSMALHALGKLHDTLSQTRSSAIKAGEAKAVVFFQAAVLVHSGNHLATHDLGVLLARCGRYAEARSALEHSLSLNPQPTGWRNLAIVYRQLGWMDRAQRAVTLSQQPTDSAGKTVQPPVPIQWVDGAAFAQLPTDAATLPSALPLRQNPQQVAPATPAASNRVASPPTPARIPLR